MLTTLNYGSGKYVRVKGPAFIELLSGEFLALGRVFREKSRLKIPKGRVICFKILKEATLKASIGEGGVIEEANPNEEAVDEWLKISDIIVERASKKAPFKVVILGDVDSGKSTLATFITNRALEQGLTVAIIDGDVGQADIGAPTTISLSIPEKPLTSLRELSPQMSAFIGSITPMGLEHTYILKLDKLMREAARKAKLVIVNTDGWVRGLKALEFKLNLIKTVKPDVVIGMSKERAVEHILEVVARSRISEALSAPTPSAMHKRSRGERRILRSQAYFKVLSQAKVRTVDASELLLIGFSVFVGESLEQASLRKIEECLKCRVKYAEKTRSYLTVVAEREPKRGIPFSLLKSFFGVDEVKVVKRGYERGVIVGILGEDFEDAGVGVIESFDYEKKAIRLKTRYEGAIRGLVSGRVRLNENFEEIEVSPYPLL